MKEHQGFTLIELLVSMSLLSMIILVGASAFGLFGQRWEGQLGNFDMTMRNVQHKLLVQDVLDSLVPYVAYDEQGKPVIYFEGNRNGFVAVSSKSIYSYGDFSVVRFSVKQNVDLTFDVLYEEWPMDNTLLIHTGVPLAFAEPLILFKSVTDPVFEYYGWPDLNARGKDDGPAVPPHWASEYDGVLASFAPLKAKLRFKNSSGDLIISSTLAGQSKGLLGRYQVGDENCNC